MMGTGTNFNVERSGTRQNGVTSAIQLASAKTGVDFDYLVKQAKVESSLNPNAKARGSSATGLYQFIEQTWLRMVKNHGAEHGYGKYADAIRQNGNGDYVVSNRAMRNHILNMRKDPQASSLMAAELATENNQYLQAATGQQPNETDLYLAHFLGAGGASNFLNSMKKNPWAPASSLFPEAARTNRAVFYQNGKPLSLQAIYNRFEAKFQGGSDGPVVQTANANLNIYRDNDVIMPGKATLSLYEDGRKPNTSEFHEARLNSIAQRIAANRVTTGLSAFSSDSGEPRERVMRIAENNAMGSMGFLRNPVQVMFMAQADNDGAFQHNRNDRYNA